MWLPVAESDTQGGSWHIPAPKRLGQKDHEVGAGLDYIVRHSVSERETGRKRRRKSNAVFVISLLL